MSKIVFPWKFFGKMHCEYININQKLISGNNPQVHVSVLSMNLKRSNNCLKNSFPNMICVIVIFLISCAMIVSFCSKNSRKCERENGDAEERKNTLLMISDNFLVRSFKFTLFVLKVCCSQDPEDPESSSLRGISSESVFSNDITTVYPPVASPSTTTSAQQSSSSSSQ